VLSLVALLIALELLWWPQQQVALRISQSDLAAAQQRFLKAQNTPAPTTPVATHTNPWASLDRHTISEIELSAKVRQIVALAKSHGVVLTQSEFQTITEGHGGLRQVQITLPVRASYPQLRAFVETVLRQLPMVSVDQIALKREAIVQASVEVRLKLSVWVDPRKVTASTARGVQR
jgi:hypothetical protein